MMIRPRFSTIASPSSVYEHNFASGETLEPIAAMLCCDDDAVCRHRYAFAFLVDHNERTIEAHLRVSCDALDAVLAVLMCGAMRLTTHGHL